ncbi:GFA family protein [Rhodotorula paludigena]|uniref:GFA family protein n=1 Tax=Rhodotorula paludigena TaxID=86838 RepID=UPI003173284F
MNLLSTLFDNGDMTATPAIGRCCCGKVEVTLLDGMPKSGTHCHCKNCRTTSGGVGIYFFILPSSAFSVKGQDELCSYTDLDTASGKPMQRSYCRTCFSCAVFFASSRSLPVLIAASPPYFAGLFPAESLPPPVVELFTAECAPWYRLHEGAAHFEGMPPR